MKRIELCSLLMGVMLLLPMNEAFSQRYMTKEGHVEFDSSVPLHTFTGTSNFLVGKIDLSSSIVDFYLDLKTLKTGIGRRDNDMYQTLETEKYPFAEFYGRISSKYKTDVKGTQRITVKGKFSIHGVTRAVTIPGTMEITGSGLKIKADWTINMVDYKIEPPGILFYRVSEKIPVSISATLAPINKN